MKTLVQKKQARPPVPSPAPVPAPPRARRDGPRSEARPAPGAAHDFGGIALHPPTVGGTGADGVLRAARRGVEGAGAPLPHLDAIQRSFGRHDLSGVRARVGGEAAAAGERMGAAAYATGSRVGFRERPTLWTAAHEAAHVVQQRAGLRLDGGVGRAGDRHERHADAVAARVARGLSAEGLLDAYGPAAARGTEAAAVQKQDEAPSLKPHYKNKALDVYEYRGDGKTTWIDPYKVLFLGGGGYDTFAWAKAKGYSTFAALFIVAHATLESDFGKGNYGAAYKNLFSVMGGPPGNKGTAHGRLQSYASYEEGLEAYASLLASRWPKTVEAGTGLYFKSSFTPDEINRAFRQYTHYNQGGPVYLGDPAADYGAQLFTRMGFIAGPFTVLVREKLSQNAQAMELAYSQTGGAADEDDYWRTEVRRHVEIHRKLYQYFDELQTARAEARARLDAHAALKKAGKIGPKP